ncbi:DUF3052 domain-containing protein [Bauldia sp.]|uniref:DUF3052 domain-containing protein n=1 Tax=Bauldia sp. TaxID=2575872 RepID=UPI003BA945DE
MTTAETAGYSGKPISAKLGFKPGMTAAFVALPRACESLAAWPDFGTVTRADTWTTPLKPETFDLIHAFTASAEELAAGLPMLQAAIRRDGMIWISWPKKAAKVPTDVTEDVVRSAALRLDLVDVKVAAIDAVWSGLKLVIRKERR